MEGEKGRRKEGRSTHYLSDSGELTSELRVAMWASKISTNTLVKPHLQVWYVYS